MLVLQNQLQDADVLIYALTPQTAHFYLTAELMERVACKEKERLGASSSRQDIYVL